MSTPTTPSQAAPDRAAVAQMVDHTLLKAEVTRGDVRALIAEAQQLGVYSICVSPSMLPVDAGAVLVATVCGFPSGKHHSEVKAAEAARAVADGAHEVDMVIDIGSAKAGEWSAVQADISTVRAAAPAPTVLKVIIESAALTDEEIVGACRAAEAAGADFVKTSTGFHPAGGATAHAVALMSRTVGGRLGVKASGGIRTGAAAREMIAAGATRLGLSGTAAVLDGLDQQPPAEDGAGAADQGY
ncbi:deoxyribose-phosphate aldolase [Actinotalea sp. K2]|uniref:deoxyribose-phosphate aldolase n=1 Tax=Actinotalea sp. K2 TaxID=2939438 RepID=UPI0020178595|nr:deoxyribose-phosphate aldolase [Actinotalea sp. K2]MCL3862627.1 deoxyribose-phosphate aldolase [Actinotalea sp. K2]